MQDAMILHSTLFPMTHDLISHVRYQEQNRRWTVRETVLLRRLYATTDTDVIATMLSRAPGAVKCKAQIIGVVKANKKVWTKSDDAVLRKMYATTLTSVIARQLKSSVPSVYNRAFKLGLKKDPAFVLEINQALGKKLADMSAGKRFQKGQISWNKGKTWDEMGLSEEARKRSSNTQFKKGQLPHTTVYDGCITIRTDTYDNGDQRPYKWIRIAKAKWKMYHVYLWENAHGPVPEGHVVVFRDGDSMNCELSNLELITKAELMRRNTLHQYPPELKDLIKLNNKLKKAIHEKQNG